MKTNRLLLVTLCSWLCLMPLAAQSVKLTGELTHVQMASVLAMYKNEFGSFENHALDDPFPYSVIRMHLEGNAHAVTAAKERITLYLGQQFRVESRITTYSNQILFLVRARRPYIYIDCGDGCEPKLLSAGQQLRSNCLYDCTVRYTPAGETPTNLDTEMLSNLETRLDSLQVAQDQKIESLHQAQLAAQEKPLIVRYSLSEQKLYGIAEYSFEETQMDKKALQAFLLENSPAAYKRWMKGHKTIKTGWVMLGLSSVCIIYDAIAIPKWDRTPSGNEAQRMRILWSCASGLGGAFILASIPCFGVGAYYKNSAYKTYNYEQKKKQPQVSLGLQASENGIGLALQF